MGKFELTNITDPRQPEYWKKAFPELSDRELEIRRLDWIQKNITKNN